MAQQSIKDPVASFERKGAEYEAERAQVRELYELRDDLRPRIQAMGAEIRDEIDPLGFSPPQAPSFQSGVRCFWLESLPFC